MSESVYILGGGRTDFKRNLKKEGKTIRHIIIEAGKKAIEDAKIGMPVRVTFELHPDADGDVYIPLFEPDGNA